MTPAQLPLRYTRMQRFAWDYRYQVWLAGRKAGTVSRNEHAGRLYWLYTWGAPDAPYINHQARTRDAAVRGRLAIILTDAAWLHAWVRAGDDRTEEVQ